MGHDTQKRYKLIQALAEIVEELGWIIAIPPDQVCPGLIVGEESYVKAIVTKYYGARFEVINPNAEKDSVGQMTLLTEDEFDELGENERANYVQEKEIVH